ncbi:MAG: non-canonical purine NTP pyrophosphatase [Gemmatimonadetes bacterium]|nr:MAG: non-canonical purine NTP pyrophosphatase [Gemmatimonadota bacterium]
MKLLVATRSPGKVREIRELFAGLPFEIQFPADRFLERLPEEADLERGSTYTENATAKARYFAQRSGFPTVADDSGLEVDALGGAPGIHSARWARETGEGGAGGGGLDARNNALLLERLAGVPETQRTARYRCIVAYLETPSGIPEIVEASCEGFILPAPRGTGGFGYDPLFFSTDLRMSFGEAPPAAKHRVSHRGRAFRALIEVLLRRVK